LAAGPQAGPESPTKPWVGLRECLLGRPGRLFDLTRLELCFCQPCQQIGVWSLAIPGKLIGIDGIGMATERGER